MYLTNEQTNNADVLIRLTRHGFIATATFPADVNLSQSEPYEVVTVPLAPSARAQYLNVNEWSSASVDALVSDIIETARRAAKQMPNAEFLRFDIEPEPDETEES